MGKIITISGTRSVGKTSLVNSLKKMLPELYYRDSRPVVTRKYNTDVEKEYYDNERLYIKQQVDEYRMLKKQEKNSILVRGTEDLLFYAIHFPKTRGKSWDVRGNLRSELNMLDENRSDCIIFLYADKETVLARSKHDTNKKRTSMEHWIDHWHDSIYKYMQQYSKCIFIDTNQKTREEVLECVVKIIENTFIV